MEETYFPMLNSIRTLIKDCEKAGQIGSVGDPEDFLMLLGLLWRIPPHAEGEARVKRLLALAFRGLKTEQPNVNGGNGPTVLRSSLKLGSSGSPMRAFAERHRSRAALRPALPPWPFVALWRKDGETESVKAFIAAALD
jgi:hypothetical protein